MSKTKKGPVERATHPKVFDGAQPPRGYAAPKTPKVTVQKLSLPAEALAELTAKMSPEDAELFRTMPLLKMVVEKKRPSASKKGVLGKPDRRTVLRFDKTGVTEIDLATGQRRQRGTMPTTPKSHGPLRDRSGYTAPTRAGKASIQAFVDPDTRDKFNELAIAAGLTASELLRHLVERTVAKGTDASISAAISDEAHRADDARKRLLRKIIPAVAEKPHRS